MKTVHLLENLHFDERHPASEALLGDAQQRILRFCLQPHQSIPVHRSPASSASLIVLAGSGLCSGEDGIDILLNPCDLALLDVGEAHALRALDQEWVFLLVLQGVPGEHAPVGSSLGISESIA